MENQNEKIEVLQFSIEEIIINPIFIRKLKGSISKLKKERNTREAPKEGFRFKRDWFDRMETLGVLNYNYFIKNIPSIWVKNSNLNSETRNIILSICNDCVLETLDKINQDKKPKKSTNGNTIKKPNKR